MKYFITSQVLGKKKKKGLWLLTLSLSMGTFPNPDILQPLALQG